MLGKTTLFVPGFGHAGISTQSVVEHRLFKQEGKTRTLSVYAVSRYGEAGRGSSRLHLRSQKLIGIGSPISKTGVSPVNCGGATVVPRISSEENDVRVRWSSVITWLLNTSFLDQ